MLNASKLPLATRVNAHSITFTYDTHGDKHVAGGPAGTKFLEGKATVNPALVHLITPEVGRVRRDANGKAQTYYMMTLPQRYSGRDPVCIQVDYMPGFQETITYHGYPSPAVVLYVLPRTLGGIAIA